MAVEKTTAIEYNRDIMIRKILSFILICLGITSLGYGFFLAYQILNEEKNIRQRANDALPVMYEILPEETEGLLYEEDGQKMGAVEINGLSFVGYMKIGDAFAAAVQNEAGSKYATRLEEGSIRSGTAVIYTDEIGADEIELGMPVWFTDVDGIRYSFSVGYIGDEKDVLKNAKLIIMVEGMTKTAQIGCAAE